MAHNIRTICICGGGSLGLVCAGVFLQKGVKVNILSGHPNKWSKHIIVEDVNGANYSGTLNKISSNPENVIPEADMIFLTLPGFMIEDTLCKIEPYLNSDSIVGSVVSSTGFFFAAHRVLSKRHCIFGFQRVPFIARQKKYGAIGELLGHKPVLNLCIENCDDSEVLKNELSYLFDTPIRLLNNFYEASLTNSNPILHTGRLYSMWHNYDGVKTQKPSLFYSEWTDEASDLLIKMDNEFQALLKKLNVSPDAIPSILEYYESSDAPSLTRKIKSIQAFQSITSPMIETKDGWIPDFNSRYFTEDFPFGLRFIKELATEHNISTPYIDLVYNWGISHISTK